MQIPTTIITGFLGAGKTTLVNHVLTSAHDMKVAVIENEFGEVGIDNEILFEAAGERIVAMANGCICCTVRGDLMRILDRLAEDRREGRLAFERVLIETTGLADPAPIVQTFFAEESVAGAYRLDGIVTVVDALHAMAQLDEHAQAVTQVGYADRILISKADRVAEHALDRLRARLRSINGRAPMSCIAHGVIEPAGLFDLGGFVLDDARLAASVGSHDAHPHAHVHGHDAISSFVWREARALDLAQVEAFLSDALESHGRDLLRYKGVLNVAGRDGRIVFQGVQLTFGCDDGRPWIADEPRESVLVFIGRNLPREAFVSRLARCVAESSPAIDSACGNPVEPTRSKSRSSGRV